MMLMATDDSNVVEQKILKIALKDARWMALVQEEIQALERNKTWTFVPHQTHGNVIGSK